ncbi:hypothetical protein ACFLWO_00890 [Chloroflexota bacterium]
MNDRQLQTVEQVRQFLEGSEAVAFRGLTAKEKYCWIEEVLPLKNISHSAYISFY